MDKSFTSVEPKGNKEERNLFRDVHNHYMLSKRDLETRITRKNGFDDADKMFASHIDESNWPYKSLMFDPRPYTTIIEKTARLIGSKPKGRLVPREGGDSLGAMVNNELLSFQWDDNTRLGESMIAKWIDMDMNTRKYGSSFAIAKWNYTTKIIDGKRKVCFDGPDFVVCNPRDVLANPSYHYIHKWFQHREWLTLKDLQNTNDVARTAPVYKNLDVLRTSLREEDKTSGDRRDTSYNVKNKSMRGLEDYLGSDEVNKVLEIVTEYRPDRWITFVPRHGVVLRNIPNPYKHYEIPVIQLKYYPLPDDLYGVNEFEPVSKLIRGINSLFSQYIDNITVDLYPPLMVNPVNVRMHTLEFTPEAKWLMNNPGEDVVRLQTSTTATNNFQGAYSLMSASLLNAWGETSQGVSAIDPFNPEKTATEIRDTAFQRNVRDNMNQIFLSEALKKQVMFWHSMNQQFLFQGTDEQTKVIRIVGRDAVDFFERQGLSEISPTEEEALAGSMDPTGIVPEGPRYPVDMGDGNMVPKFSPDEMGSGGDLYIEPGDLIGNYDYIPDIETMQAPSNEKVEQKLTAVLGVITNPAVMQMLQLEGKKPKVMELLVKLFESTRVIKDAEAYFEDIQEGGMSAQGQIVPGGANPAEAGVSGQGNGVPTGVAGNNQAAPGVGSQVVPSGPAQVY